MRHPLVVINSVNSVISGSITITITITITINVSVSVSVIRTTRVVALTALAAVGESSRGRHGAQRDTGIQSA